MRTLRILMLSGLAGCLAGTCLAEPPTIIDPANAPAAFHPATEAVAFLGVATAPASRALSSQIRLPAGVGLVVHHVVPDSPAADAGLRRDDVMHKLDDQLLVNAEQLAVLVRTFDPGDEVELTVIRAGESIKLTATLAEKEQPVLGPGGRRNVRMAPPMFPPGLNNQAQPCVTIPGALRGPLGDGVIRMDDFTNLRWYDGDHEIQLRSQGDGAWVARAFDRHGKPVGDAEFQRIDELPEAIRSMLSAVSRRRSEEAKAPAATPQRGTGR